MNDPDITMIRLVPAELISFSTEARAPLPIDIMLMTAATPMIMPSAVSAVRSLFLASAVSATRSVTRIDMACSLPGYPLSGRQAPQFVGGAPRQPVDLVPHDSAVAERDDPAAVAGDVGLVRDEHDGQAVLGVEALEDVHDLDARARVEVARRLVGEQDRGIVHERPRDGDALLLAARELVRVVARAVAQTDGGERRERARAALRGRRRRALVQQRQLHVLERARAREQVEALEDEPDARIAHRGEIVA